MCQRVLPGQARAQSLHVLYPKVSVGTGEACKATHGPSPCGWVPRAGMTLQDAMSATPSAMQRYADATNAAKATASTGNSPLLNKWRKRCKMYGNKLDEFQLIKFLAKDMDVKMRKNDPIILMVEMNTCYSSKVLISMASNKRGV